MRAVGEVTGPAGQIQYLKGPVTTHPRAEERGVCTRGVAKEEILRGAVGKVEGGPDIGDSGKALVMDSFSRRTLVIALGTGCRTPVSPRRPRSKADSQRI